ncbi:MAG: hypothetical protein M3Q55_07285 [Acidobacteriota bacterium]|nr:hypothetical protein [Acidobacteriota bacterium]
MRGHINRAALLIALAAGVSGSTSCTSAVRQGTGSSYLIIETLQGVSGQSGDEDSDLNSDVVALVEQQINGVNVMVPTIFEDGGLVSFRLAMKDAGGAASPTTPTTNNFITVNRYRVSYSRTDGRNTPGVDVPFPFEGAFTVTVGTTAAEAGFVLVRLQAKAEAPLLALRNGSGAFAISTIAEVTFYGQDQTGHAVSVTGRISVNFADWADEE